MSFADVVQLISTLAACFAAIAAAVAISSNTKNARKRATIDLIMHQDQDRELQTAITTVNRLARQRIPLVEHFKEDDTFREAILRVLNAREFTSTGIFNNVFDEEIYKQSQYTVFTRDWGRLEDVVEYIRQHTGRETIYQDFQLLNRKWQNAPLEKRKL